MELMEWLFANTFAPVEAAGLIMGFNPTALDDLQKKAIAPVIRRMETSYESACASYSWDVGGFYSHAPESEAAKNQNMTQLRSEAMISALIRSFGRPEHFTDWYTCNDYSDFKNQQFSRSELSRWLADNNLPTKYEFGNDSGAANPPVLSSDGSDDGPSIEERPLSSNERNTLLLVIAALADKANLDLKHHGSASAISAMIEMLGAKVTRETIRSKLDLIPTAVARREVVLRTKPVKK